MKHLTAIFLLLLMGCFAHAQRIDSDILGTWKGELSEPGRSGAYDVKITLTNNGNSTIYYSDYDCGGKLTLLKVLDDGQHIFRETITEGIGNCIDQGLVSVMLFGDELLLTWQHEVYEHHAKGSLTR